MKSDSLLHGLRRNLPKAGGLFPGRIDDAIFAGAGLLIDGLLSLLRKRSDAQAKAELRELAASEAPRVDLDALKDAQSGGRDEGE